MGFKDEGEKTDKRGMDNNTLADKARDNTVWNLIQNLSQKAGISEIVINGPKGVFAEKEGKFYPLDAKLVPDHLMSFVQDVAEFNKKECHRDCPIMDGILPDGSRINIIVAPFVKEGVAITIRKYLHKLKTFDTSPGLFGLNPSWTYFLKTLVKAKVNLIVAGGTGVGKTTFLNLMLQEIPKEERVITIEDTRELHFNLPNVVHMESGGGSLASKAILTHKDLVKNALRMRPDRIIIGEVRGEEIIDLLMAMNTGHDGCMTSLHANSPTEALGRMVNLYLMGGRELPMKAIHGQIQSAISFIIQVSRNRSNQRVVTHITELTGMENDVILSQQIGVLAGDQLKPTGIVPSIMGRITKYGLDRDYFKTAF